MKSLSELFAAIMSIPFLETDLKVRAGFLQSRLCNGRGYDIGSLFGFRR